MSEVPSSRARVGVGWKGVQEGGWVEGGRVGGWEGREELGWSGVEWGV